MSRRKQPPSGRWSPGKARLLITGALCATTALLGVGAAGTFSCVHSEPGRGASSSPSSKASQPSVQAAKGAPASSREPLQSSYADAIRRRQFQRAAQLIDQLPAAERAAPEVRYARALVAIELSDVETALQKMRGFEQDHPDFAEEARSVRREAAERSQDVTLLSHFLGGSRDPKDLLLLAEAHARSASLVEARRLADQALGLLNDKRTGEVLELRARAHELRAQSLAAEDKNEQAAKEYRWLATHAASLDRAARYDESMSKLDPSSSLSTDERMSRAKTFSEAGWVERTQAELDKLNAKELGGQAEQEALMAWAIYVSRTDYLRASELFAQAAAHGGKDRQKHLYYEAKALARSHRDSEAIEKYERVAQMPGSYADHAAYQAARLRFIDGQWEAAVVAYQRYLKRYGASAKHKEAATHDLPVARLAALDFAPAVGEIQKLIQKESSSRERARLMQLEGVALLGAEKEEAAIEKFESVIRYRPLSLPALLSEARLRKLGRTPPTPILPSTDEQADQPDPPLALSLPDKAFRLQKVGLDEQAERVVLGQEGSIRRQHPGRGGEALCKLYGQLNSAKRRYQIAQTAASWSVLKHAPNTRTEWQWDCIYPEPYREVVDYEGATRQVPPAFIYAVMRQESGFRPTVVSPADAVGLMQIIPPTAARIAQEINATYDPDLMRAPAVNIRFGAYYLRRLLDMFQNRLVLATAAYNAGPHAVTRWLRRGQSLPLDVFIARIPYSETRNYVYRVLGNYARYSYRTENKPESRRVPQLDLEIPQGLKATDDAY